MAIIDRVEIKVRAGDGGDGAVSFRREKFAPLGGPDGGDGGDGGNVKMEASSRYTTLRNFLHRRYFEVEDGRRGSSNRKFGKMGKDVVIEVPAGTVVIHKGDGNDDRMIVDMDEPHKSAVVAAGGKGGRGNARFATSTNQTPRLAEKGTKGEEKTLLLELKLIADIGIVGFPNAGKSTLLSALTAAKPKIAGYPFTTLEPALGVAEVGNTSFVVAEIPGLIKGAHTGKGLGYDFLRHAERTTLVIHLIDGTSESPVDNMNGINEELKLYNSELRNKKQIVVVNKIDIPEVESRVELIRKQFNDIDIEPLFISAAGRINVNSVALKAAETLQTVRGQKREAAAEPVKIFRPEPAGKTINIRVENGVYIIESRELERVVEAVDPKDPEVLRQVKWYMERLHITRSLEKMGITPGSRLRCGESEWEW